MHFEAHDLAVAPESDRLHELRVGREIRAQDFAVYDKLGCKAMGACYVRRRTCATRASPPVLTARLRAA
eukprot:7899441-Pyramimonas_sp.AAC.1